MSVSVKGPDHLEIEYSPIYFSEEHRFDQLNVIDVRALGLNVASHSKGPSRLSLDLLQLSNIKAYNMVLNSFSWTVNSSIGYQERFIYDQSFSFGRAWNVVHHSMVYALLGGATANFDEIAEQLIEDERYFLTAELGSIHQLNARTKLSLAYKRRYNATYFVYELMYNADPAIYQLRVTQKEDEALLGVGAKVLF